MPPTSKAAASMMSIDATQFSSAGDMCAAIAAACATVGTTGYPAGTTIDARGFTGTQVCSGTLTTTTMLNACVSGTNHNGGKLLLGNVNLYIDGPASGSYTDGSSGVGTPAIIIPSKFWGIEGISRGATANGTNAGLGTFLSVCTGNGTPIGGTNGCHNAFPQRSFSISSSTVSVNTMTIVLSTTPPSGSFYSAELVMVKGSPTVSENGTYKLQSFSGGTLTVTVPTGTASCTSGCGTLYHNNDLRMEARSAF